MICTNCGAQVSDGSKFCSQCGSPLSVVPRTYVQQQNTQSIQQGHFTEQSFGENQYQGQHNGQPAGMPQQAYPGQKQTFVVRRMPIIVIIVLTLGFFFGSFFMEDGSMSVATAVSCVPGVVLLFLIFKMDRIEPEPVGLLVKLFLAGGFIATLASMFIEIVLGVFVGIMFEENTILYCAAEAFIVAALTEELCKYVCLKFLTWKHPAFNYRFDGVVYSTAVAIGFDVIENLLYLADSTADTAFIRAAFPGHCVFGIYMGYYYGQAKTLELNGDRRGAAAMRKKGVLTAILIHGFYDFVCFMGGMPESELLQMVISLGLVALMVVLNVNAYKNIKKFAYNDNPV